MKERDKKILYIVGISLGSIFILFMISLLIYNFYFSKTIVYGTYNNSGCCGGITEGYRSRGGMMGRIPTTSIVDDYSDVTSTIQYGSGLALKDTDLTLSDMLTYAIQDEYLAKATYQAIIDKYGTSTVFSNIINAESNHIEALKVLLKANNITVPEDKSSSYVTVPSTLDAAYEAAIKAEVLNIKMYDLFLNESLNTDVRTTFESLMNASNHHLRSFEMHSRY